MALKRARLANEDPKLEMTPMIDVVFQLLIFFIVTLKQEDILSRLMAARPAPDPNAVPENQPDLINIVIHKGGFVFKGRPVDLPGLDRQIERYSKLSKSANVLVRCTLDSPHAYLVQALDICSKYGMLNLSIFSM
jgi:biopolymer transport protein ExbD